MNVRIDSQKDSVLELAVELNRSDLEPYIREAEREALGGVKVDGFRDGKAPEHIARERVDQAAVRQHALEKAIEGSFKEAIREQNLDVADTADLAIVENTESKLAYRVRVSTFPIVTLPDPTTIEIEQEPISDPNDDDVTKALETVRKSRAVFKDKKDSAVLGDRVEVDFDVVTDGKTVPGGKSSNHPVVLGSGGFIPGFEEQLIGMSEGESKTFALEAPKDYFDANIAGKKLSISVTVKKVQSVVLPELNDTFAQGLGSFSKLDDVRTNIREGIRQERLTEQRQKHRIKILDSIIGASDIAVPAFLLQQQLDRMIADFDQDLHRRGMELRVYLSRIGKTEEDLRSDWKLEAQRQVKSMLILHAIAREQDVRANPEEVSMALEGMLQEAAGKQGVDPKSLDIEGLRVRIAERMINEKVFEYLESTVGSARSKKKH